MSKILAFDTSGPYCAASLTVDGSVVASRSETMQKGQAERLMPLLEETLKDMNLSWRDLDRIGVGTGPGNFTGIRISVSAARGLGLSLGVPVLGVSALEAQAYGQSGLVVSSLDARQDRLYVGVLGQSISKPAVLCDLDSLPIIPASAEPLCIGHRAAEIADRCMGHVVESKHPISDAIALIAATREPDQSRPAPLYIRPADAAPPRDPAPVIL